jgi:hypothetical protein
MISFIRRRAAPAATTFALLLFFAAAANAEPAGNDRKGKHAYREVYEKCMARGEVTEAKPPINPDSKTQSQWDRVFRKKEFAQFGCAAEWNALSDEELNNILAYLSKHAADSPTPAKCK